MQGIAHYLHKKISSQIMFQSPSALFILKYRNLSPALLRPVALREYKNIQSGQIPSAAYSGERSKGWKRLHPVATLNSLTFRE